MNAMNTIMFFIKIALKKELEKILMLKNNAHIAGLQFKISKNLKSLLTRSELDEISFF